MTAIQLLKQYGMENNIPLNLTELLEKLGIKVYLKDFSEIAPDISGFIKKTDSKTESKADILINNKDSHPRQRFTIAHELAHYFLHMQDADGTHIELRDAVRTKKEVEADKFAAELLMPEHLITQEYEKCVFPTAEELAAKFRVSLSAMKYRMNNLELWYYD